MATGLKTTPLRPSKAPNLLIAPTEYSQQYQDQLINALRLYFAQIDNYGQGLVADSGGSYLGFPHISAINDENCYADANNTPTIVRWTDLITGSDFTLNSDNTATATKNGFYNIIYSVQVANTSNTITDAQFWLRVNNIDVPYSSSIFTVPARKSAGVPSQIVAYSSVLFQVNAGDKIGLWWATNLAATAGGTLGLYFPWYPAQTSPYKAPSNPSVVGSITFVSHA